MLICFGIAFFCYWDNYLANKAEEWHEDLEGEWLIRGTIAAHGTEEAPSILQPWLLAVLGWVVLIFFTYVKYKSDEVIDEI